MGIECDFCDKRENGNRPKIESKYLCNFNLCNLIYLQQQ